MRPFLVLYATREGHTRRIAEHVADTLQSRGFSSKIVDVATLPAEFSIEDYCGAFIAASVHKQKHEREMTAFVKHHAAELERIPTAFVSVSLSEAGAEDTTAPEERRTQASNNAQRMIDTFLAETGWRPGKVRAVAGALMYSKYNYVLRLIMKRIARQAGGDTDTTRDYDYTDYKSLDDFVDVLTKMVQTGDMVTL
jgi:menaquinone-dependent protoporphyrinogen oxidase